MKTRYLRSLLAAAAFVPVAASANLAITTQGVNMRAGPDTSYPQVAYLGPGMNVNVVGCIEGWQWCDVIAGPNRGWVYSGYLSYSYYDRPTLIAYGGPTLGIPLISFSIGPYWDNYYRGRPFWHQRSYWYNHRVARAPEWHAPPGWHGDDWRAHDGRGNDWRRHDNGRGNDGRGHDDRRIANDWNTNPANPRRQDPVRPNDQFNPNVQQ
jgi:uncharacterized protein YraI